MSTSNSATSDPISLGVHSGEIDNYFAMTSPDKIFTPLMTEAGILPPDMRGAKILPAVSYGVEATRPEPFKAVELVPGSPSLVKDALGSPYFNPHISIKARAQNLATSVMGKGKNRMRGNSFGFSSYVLQNGSAVSLFVDGAPEARENIDEKSAERLAESYALGIVVVGSEVLVGRASFDLGKTSLPALVREVGQNINNFKIPNRDKATLLKEVRDRHTQGLSPDYREYVKTRKGWPSK